ncbi:MAG TPA: hypothetical protein VN756_09925 [Solirubrobacterales bacterium]|nr:hypothetical protein [Solirubrobacterales bacterium]
MIRLQLGCLECRQILDGTFAAEKVESIVAAFNSAHLIDRCKEEPDGGEAREGTAAGSPEPVDSGEDEGGSAGPASGKPH